MAKATAPEVEQEEPPYRLTGREALLIQAQRLRAEAGRLEKLAHAIPANISLEADEGLWHLVHSRKL